MTSHFMIIFAVVIAVSTALPMSKQPGTFEMILKANKASNRWIEGDIVDTQLTRKQMSYASQDLSKFSGYDAQNSGVWPNGVIPYKFGTAGFAAQSAVKSAIQEYNSRTCVKFVPYTNEADYIIFNEKDGCYSHIGRIGGEQEISLGKGCEHKYIAMHEMMHAIGFFHEQSRRDRDQYITINFNNIPTNMRNNFDKYTLGQATTHNEPYDKQSLMHYEKYAFAIDTNIPTITSKSDPNEAIGNRNGFTQIDITQINKHYNCGTTNPNTPGPNTPPPQTNGPNTWGPNTWGPIVTNPPTGNCQDDDVQNCPYFVGDCKLDYIANYCKKSCGKCT